MDNYYSIITRRICRDTGLSKVRITSNTHRIMPVATETCRD
jgi:hypothetical protein